MSKRLDRENQRARIKEVYTGLEEKMNIVVRARNLLFPMMQQVEATDPWINAAPFHDITEDTNCTTIKTHQGLRVKIHSGLLGTGITIRWGNKLELTHEEKKHIIIFNAGYYWPGHELPDQLVEYDYSYLSANITPDEITVSQRNNGRQVVDVQEFLETPTIITPALGRALVAPAYKRSILDRENGYKRNY